MSSFEISKFSLKRGGGLIEGGFLISDRRYIPNRDPYKYGALQLQ